MVITKKSSLPIIIDLSVINLVRLKQRFDYCLFQVLLVHAQSFIYHMELIMRTGISGKKIIL